MTLPKTFKGDKYIYLLMAIRLCQKYKLTPEDKASAEPTYTAIVGDDNGIVGGQNYWRAFKLWQSSYTKKWILQETKTSSSSATFSKIYEAINPQDKKPTIKEYFNEDGENSSNHWEH